MLVLTFFLALFITIQSEEEEAVRAADADRQLEKLKARRKEVRRRITLTCSEVTKIIKRVGSRASLNTLVAQAEQLLLKSEKLNDQMCVFKEKVDTAKEFQSQLEYQRIVHDAKEEELLSRAIINIYMSSFLCN